MPSLSLRRAPASVSRHFLHSTSIRCVRAVLRAFHASEHLCRSEYVLHFLLRREPVVWHHSLLIEHVSLGMPLKRKPAPGAACAPVQTLNGSRFVECPICSQKVAHYLINSHLDSECGKSTSSPADVAHKPCLQLQDPKTKRSRHMHVGAGVQHTARTQPCPQ